MSSSDPTRVKSNYIPHILRFYGKSNTTMVYELAPVPPSMFDDKGDMRITKSKSTLESKLQVEISERLSPAADAIILDGCAILWVISWHTAGAVEDFIMNILSYIFKQLKQCDYLIFDRYYDDSIKYATRNSRAGKEASRVYQLQFNTPLPPQKVTLTVTANKVQLINLIHVMYEYIREHSS